MNQILSKKSIVKKTIQVGGSTLASRLLGLIRETLMARYLGTGIIADAFITAYKLPNSLRKIFAEGALSASLVPKIVSIVRGKDSKENKEEVNSLVSLVFLMFEGFLLLFCIFVYFFSDFIVSLTTPGFSASQIAFTSPLLKTLIFFILFLSSSAILTGALQSVNHFIVPAIAPVFLNIVFIGALLLSIAYSLPVTYLCYILLAAGFLQFIMHLIAYFKLGFRFGPINEKAKENFNYVIIKFLPICFSMSIMEINLFIDVSLASYLPSGSISLIHYASRFMQIPLGVFATAFSTILLPHFSQISKLAPKRLSYYLFESTKLVFWITLPATILMSFFAKQIFITLFMSKNFSLEKVIEAQYILIAFLAGLFFFSINRILLNIFYSLHDTLRPTLVAIAATISNYYLNYYLITIFKATGSGMATTVSLGMIQTFLFYLLLLKYYKFTIYSKHLLNFFIRCLLQITSVMSCFFIIYYAIHYTIHKFASPFLLNLLFNTLFFWAWAGPLCASVFLALYLTKKHFGVKLYFLD